MMKIAVIGGSGFIGTRLVSRLVKAGREVVIIDKEQSRAFPHLWVYGDVREIDTLSTVLQGCDVLYNLAAEHSDRVSPESLYFDVNVDGAENVCKAAVERDVRRIVFTSSVAVYGNSPLGTDESAELNPVNPYGRSKMLAEDVYRKWYGSSAGRSLVIVRPTVVFGEDNRGNVYNLLRQIASGRFLMIGSGKNMKSMAYVENVAAFLDYLLIYERGENIFNYADKPDFDMNGLVAFVMDCLGRKGKLPIRIPYALGILGGYLFDFISRLTGKPLPVSSARVRKFAMNTHFVTKRAGDLYFQNPVSIERGLEKTLEYEFKLANP